MRTKMILVAGLLLITALVLAACAPVPAGAPAPAATEAAAAEGEAAAGESAAEGAYAGVDPSGQTVVWWHQHSGSREEKLLPLIEEYNQSNAYGITVAWLGRIGPVPWINNWPALTIPFMASAFSIFLLRQFFMQVPNDLWDAAQIDGAGHVRYLMQVVLPLSRAAVMTLILFGFIATWNALAWPILVTTTPDWRPISYGLLAFLDEAGAIFNLQMAGAVITMLPIVVLYFFTQRTFIEGIATTGLKG